MHISCPLKTQCSVKCRDTPKQEIAVNEYLSKCYTAFEAQSVGATRIFENSRPGIAKGLLFFPSLFLIGKYSMVLATTETK